MHETGCSGLVHWDDPEGWDGEGGGRGIQDGEHKYTLMADSSQCMAKPIQYCKLINQLKNTKIRSLQLWKIKLSFCIKKKKKNTGVGSHSLLQGIFLTQRSTLVLLPCRWILYQLSYQGSPIRAICQAKYSSLYIQYLI